MRKTGFTLVELLAVIVVLAIVLIIAVPGVLGIINQTRTNAYERQLDIIKETARTYITIASNVVWRDNQTVVNLSDLQGQGLLDRKLMDPRDKSEMKGLAVVVTRNGKQMKYKIVYTDASNANYPVFRDVMIPIVYDGTKWVKADATNEKNVWFDYTKQQWANVATVTEDVRQTLMDAKPGTEVPMDKINGMFVWIPRFKYKLFNVDGSARPVGNSNLAGDYQIDVQFEGKDIRKSMGSQNGEWLTHPAFTFGSQELDGFWMAKFETGRSDATTPEEAETEVTSLNQLVMKPTVQSWKKVNVADAFQMALHMKNDGNPYGFTDAEDPHMIKNIEWGAMNFMVESQYGKRGNSQYSAAEKRVRMNNYDGYKTGCGADSEVTTIVSVCNTYETANGQAASTTGNITGIYDISGGVWDMTAAVMEDATGSHLLLGHSTFSQEQLDQYGQEGKYLDVYAYGTEEVDLSRSHLGDAVLEMGSKWYGDFVGGLLEAGVWYFRGGSIKADPSLVGHITASGGHGKGSVHWGSRVVVV